MKVENGKWKVQEQMCDAHLIGSGLQPLFKSLFRQKKGSKTFRFQPSSFHL
ncbi:MAG: hypothetical protein KH501_04700 [Eubacterium limosum]|nr:hypothetical protein [Eubacterium limosum]